MTTSFRTESGTRYMIDGDQVMRLSERPVRGLEPRFTLVGEPIIEVGLRALLPTTEGMLRTSPVTEVGAA